MDKIKINAFGNIPTPEVIYQDFSGITIEIKKRIPYTEVLNMVQFGVDFSVTDEPVVSGVVSEMIKDFAIIKFYTNLEVSLGEDGAELSDVYNEYDVLKTLGVVESVKEKVDKEQLRFFEKTLSATIEGIVAYRNSARGMLESITASSQADISKIQEALDLFKGENGEKLGRLIQYAHEIHPVPDAPTTGK